MPTKHFQAKLKLNSVIGTSQGFFEVNVSFSDLDGVNSVYTMQLGDVLIFDTSAYQPGTLSHFKVVEILTKSFNGFEARIEYVGLPSEAPDLSWSIGADGIISRPTPNLGLLPVISADVQKTVDKYSFYTLNHNLTEILDKVSSQSVSLYTAKRLPYQIGVGAVLPHKPLGDFVNNMAILHLNMGAAIEAMDVSLFVDENGFYYVRLEEMDDLEYGDDIESITVTYLKKN